MELDEIKLKLNELCEEDYRIFTEGLVPKSELPFLGVRIPLIRQLAKEIHREKADEDFFERCDFSSAELLLLYSCLLKFKRGSAEC